VRLADRSTSLKTQQVAGPCRAKVKLPAEPVVIIVPIGGCEKRCVGCAGKMFLNEIHFFPF
jgi:hypothetical protein